MRVLLINPPYQTLTSNRGVGHQVPLGLLAIGGPLIDAGHELRLLDAECLHLRTEQILDAVRRFGPGVVMTGHAGSTPAHPVCVAMLRAIKERAPHVRTVYGGVFPTYHARAILEQEPAIDVIVRGEGEATALELVDALGKPRCLDRIAAIAYRDGGKVALTAEREPIRNLDACRVGWELIEDWDRYRCFGLGRAAVLQFSRGCPHRCTYCGQHGFWVQWRHRDPVRLADEVAWLHHEHGVRFITLADENPTTLRPVWQRFLEELAARRLPVQFFATIRATDIVRDADLLPLYRRAGILYVLMGIESTDAAVLDRVAKGSTPAADMQACRLLKQHGIYSILGYIVGFADETWASLWASGRRLAHYEGDWLNAMYVTPHDWTPFGKQAIDGAIEPNQQKWDYRHQVLGQKHLRPWQLFLWVKWTELWFHMRPRRLWELLRNRRGWQQRMWVMLHIGMVWLGEIGEFLYDALTMRPQRKGVGDRLRSNRTQVALGRPLHDRLAVGFNHHVPKRPVNAVVGERSDRSDDPVDGRGGQRDVVRIAVHEADMLAVRRDLDDVARQQRATAIGSARPAEDCSPLEMSATANQRQIVGERFGFAFPEDDRVVRPHHARAVGGVEIDGDASKSAAPLDHA
jgi:anaerobic magnesium-protoporphyrin IX monomethyl ester cyclase